MLEAELNKNNHIEKKKGVFPNWLKTLFRHKTLLVGSIFIFIFFIFTLFPFLFFSKDVTIQTDSALRLLAPSLQHPFGTDHIGRDILSRVIWGTRVSLGISVGSMMLAAIVGGTLGLISGYFGGKLDNIMGRLIDVLYSFPSQILGIFIAGILGPSVKNVIIAIAIVFIPVFYRTMRSSVVKEKEREYVEAARSLGMNDTYIMFVHVLRNSIVPVTVQFTVGLAVAIQLEAALGFLGLGVQPPAASWGSILNDGIDYLLFAPWISILPGLFMVLAVFSFNLIGDGLRDLLDPHSEK
ncbi:ABC transporter permease [Bacillus sp. Marseille-P3661]|uniref:ABC transporter permease n=1 Tax=Bacillus sp. Marseille-P3661 TaxID=1936234 RepID=UPI000C839576|nr:ABC transporter permease [Bacillus sp. Marseille-P3661]